MVSLARTHVDLFFYKFGFFTGWIFMRQGKLLQ